MSFMILLVALIIATITDIKTKTIPLWLFPLTLLLSITVDLMSNYKLTFPIKFSGMLCMFLLFLLASRFGGGGGDIIMMSVLGWIVGLRYSLYISFIAFIIYILSLFAVKNICKRKDYKFNLPFAPFVLSGTLILGGFELLIK